MVGRPAKKASRWRPAIAPREKSASRIPCYFAIAKGCGRFEWNVLDWNEPAIRVYEAIGAEAQSEWVRYRLAGEKLAAFARGT